MGRNFCDGGTAIHSRSAGFLNTGRAASGVKRLLEASISSSVLMLAWRLRSGSVRVSAIRRLVRSALGTSTISRRMRLLRLRPASPHPRLRGLHGGRQLAGRSDNLGVEHRQRIPRLHARIIRGRAQPGRRRPSSDRGGTSITRPSLRLGSSPSDCSSRINREGRSAIVCRSP